MLPLHSIKTAIIHRKHPLQDENTNHHKFFRGHRHSPYKHGELLQQGSSGAFSSSAPRIDSIFLHYGRLPQGTRLLKRACTFPQGKVSIQDHAHDQCRWGASWQLSLLCFRRRPQPQMEGPKLRASSRNLLPKADDPSREQAKECEDVHRYAWTFPQKKCLLLWLLP